MKTAIILGTALITTIGNRNDKAERISQYIDGFKAISKLVSKYPEIFDLYWTDNTIQSDKEYDKDLTSLIDTLPNLKAKTLFFENELGNVNFGAGVIAAWKKILPEIKKENYQFVIYFEPRQGMVDFSFFETFIKNPTSYFKVSGFIRPDNNAWGKIYTIYQKLFITGRYEIWTGLFSCPTKTLEGYVENKNSKKSLKMNMSIEVDLYNYIKEKKVPFVNLPYLGIIRHDTVQNRDTVI